jgi:hypothetical protein
LNPTNAMAPSVTAPVAGGGLGSTTASGGNGLFSAGGWLERNGDLVGGAVSGLAKGVSTGLAAGDAADSARADRARIDANYRQTGTGLLAQSTRAANAGNGGPSVQEKLGARLNYQYRYNPSTGTIESVPIATA